MLELLKMVKKTPMRPYFSVLSPGWFEGVGDKLEVKKGFQRHSFTKYLRPTLVFI